MQAFVASSAAASTWEDELAARVLHHVRETDGGAFVLFTSFRTLDAVAERIIDTLVDDGHPMHIQGTGVPRNTLIERFRADERSVLFGVASFWQGVDVRLQRLEDGVGGNVVPLRAEAAAAIA